MILFKRLLLLILLLGTMAGAKAQTSDEAAAILENMRLANSYFMKKWPDVGKTIITNRERPSNIWTRAVYYEGLMGLYEIDPDAAYYQYAVDWGEFHKWGFRSGNDTRNADDQCAGQTYIQLYQIDPQPGRIANIKECIDNVVAGEQNDDWWWIDAIQMAMPIYAQLGVLYDDEKYFEKMYEMYMYTRNEHGDNGLYNPKDKLWWRDADFDPPYTEPNGEDSYWSRGNGWVIMALARVMEFMPENGPHYKQYKKDFKAMSKALIKVQREDGLWNVSLHDPNHYGGKELSGTAMFVYGMAWGINNGILSEKKYLPVVEKAWDAMINDCLHSNGFLGYVQSTGKEPKDGQPVTYDSVPDFEDYALGAFLLAGKEMYLLKK
ncbi:glycoside hydrolase family 88/105 protein [Roseimarinus sediminis]|uniref:glycoside hydrolase family 88/105 protein n=1 Tax=Roseimarinus sediminis TaxID=1610899 RepID=UPI003D1D747E